MLTIVVTWTRNWGMQSWWILIWRLGRQRETHKYLAFLQCNLIWFHSFSSFPLSYVYIHHLHVKVASQQKSWVGQLVLWFSLSATNLSLVMGHLLKSFFSSPDDHNDTHWIMSFLHLNTTWMVKCMFRVCGWTHSSYWMAKPSGPVVSTPFIWHKAPTAISVLFSEIKSKVCSQTTCLFSWWKISLVLCCVLFRFHFL